MSETIRKNPFKQIQQEHNWTIVYMAGAVGSSVSELQQIFAGAIKKPRLVIEALSRYGHDPVALQAQYDGWLKERQKIIPGV